MYADIVDVVVWSTIREKITRARFQLNASRSKLYRFVDFKCVREEWTLFFN